MHVVVDTDFLSVLIKIKRMELIYRVFGVEMILVCKEQNIVTVSYLESIIEDIKKYDYMEFSQEHKRLLFE
jgi:hypothetical protein